MDAANIRTAYAQVINAALTGDSTGTTQTVVLKQTTDDWETTITWPSNLTVNTTDGGTGPKAKGTATVTYVAPTAGSSEGKVTVTYSKGS